MPVTLPGVSSRLARDSHGRLVCILTVPNGLPAGTRYVCIGNAAHVLVAGDRGRLFYFLEDERCTGRDNHVTQPRGSNRDPVPRDPIAAPSRLGRTM
jgi:hypothetical protein